MKFQICQKQKKQKQLFCLYIYLSLSPFVLFFDHLIWFALILSIFTTRILIYSIVFWSLSLSLSHSLCLNNFYYQRNQKQHNLKLLDHIHTLSHSVNMNKAITCFAFVCVVKWFFFSQ